MEGNKALTYSHISKIENGEASPTLRTLQKIAAALELPLVVVFDGKQVNTESVTIVSTPEFSETLLSVLHRKEVVQLLISCHQLTAEQIDLLLRMAASLLQASNKQDEESSS